MRAKGAKVRVIYRKRAQKGVEKKAIATEVTEISENY